MDTDIVGAISGELKDNDKGVVLGTRNMFYCWDHYNEEMKRLGKT